MTEQQIENAVDEIVSLTVDGKWEIAFEKYYHEDLEKTDLDGKTIKGKEENIKIDRDFSSKITQVRDFSSPGKIVKGNRSFLSWSLDIDVNGNPFKVVEVAIQDWEDDKIIRERFIA